MNSDEFCGLSAAVDTKIKTSGIFTSVNCDAFICTRLNGNNTRDSLNI